MEHRTQIYLEKKQYQFVKELSEKEGVSLAQTIRNLIQKEMPSDSVWTEDPLWQASAINFRSGVKNASKNHHEMLRQRLKNKRAKS